MVRNVQKRVSIFQGDGIISTNARFAACLRNKKKRNKARIERKLIT